MGSFETNALYILQAGVNLGVLYSEGVGGIKRDRIAAARLYEKAAEKGDAGNKRSISISEILYLQ